MKDLEDFFDNPGLSHIGEQIVTYLGVDDLWNLRQVNKYWKNVADIGLKKLRAHYNSQNMFIRYWYPFKCHGKGFEFWKKRGTLNYMRFHEFFMKYNKEHQLDQGREGFRKINDLIDSKARPQRLSMEWPVREGNVELLKILLPGCPNDAGTQEDNEPDLIQFAEMACRMTDNLDIINAFLDHLTKINLMRDKCVQAGFVSACGAGHEAVVKRLIEVSEEDGFNLNISIIPNIQIQSETGLSELIETSFPGHLNIVKILIEASCDKKVDLTQKNSFDLEVIEYLTEAMISKE